ncbi:MAG: DUF1592 domain-containing protein [Myxococcota bacterium]
MSIRRILLFGGSALLAACQGTFETAGSSPPVEPIVGVDAPDASVPPPETSQLLGSSGIRLLTQRQYINSLRGIMGASAPIPSVLPGDRFEHHFRSAGQAQIPADALVTELEVMSSGAAEVASLAFPSDQRLAERARCEPSAPSDPCIRGFLRRFGELAFRRPVTDAEVERWVAVVEAVAQEGSISQGVAAAAEAILSSPSFLFRIELGEPIGDGRHRYTGVEMASRLSYFFWDGPPDAELREAAADGRLETAAGVREQALRLVNDERAAEPLARFFHEYFSIETVELMTKDTHIFPEMTPGLARSMQTEMEALVARIVDGNLDPRALFSVRDTVVDAELAAVYDLNVSPPDGSFVATPMATRRQGILSTAGFLAVTGPPHRSSAVGRGIYVGERLLCVEFGEPPGDVDSSDVDHRPDVRTTMRERLAVHREDPACLGCHRVIDPVGLAMEHFDGLGRYRADDEGLPLDVTGEVDGVPIDGMVEMAEVLSTSAAVRDCMTRHLFIHAAGRVASHDEQLAITTLADELERAGDFRIRELAVVIASSEPFRFSSLPR